MRKDRVNLGASISVICGGVGLGFVHYFGGSPGSPEGWFSAIGFAAPFFGLGLIALAGTLRNDPTFVLATGVALTPLSVLSIVLIPLVVAGFVLVARSARQDFEPRDLALPAVLVSVLVLAHGFVVFHQDPATWANAEGTGGSSNIVTFVEAAGAISATAFVVVMALVVLMREARLDVDSSHIAGWL